MPPSASLPIAVDLQLLGALALSFALLALGCSVFAHNKNASVNRRFAGLAITSAGWIAAISLSLASEDRGLIVALGRTGFAFASAIPFTLVWMVAGLISPSRPFRRGPNLLLAASSASFCVLSLTPFIVRDATPGFPRSSFVYGPLHPLFGLYFLVSFVSGAYTLWRAANAASGITRLQLRYLLLGIGLAGIGAITLNLIVPVLWRTSRYSTLGPYFSLLFFSFSAHAIIRHRLMDARIFIRKGAVYLIALVALGAVLAVLAQPVARAIGHDVDAIPLPATILISLVLAVTFSPLKQRIEHYLNRYVYRVTYDYQSTVRDLTRQLSTLLDLDSLLSRLTDALERTFHAEAVTVYLIDRRASLFTVHSCCPSPGPGGGLRDAPIPISPTSPLATFLQGHRGPLVREEVLRATSRPDVKNAAEQLSLLGVDVALPLKDEQGLVGVLTVGPKRSGDPFFAEDLDLLTTLASQASVAIKNAYLYREVVLVGEYVDNILRTMDSGVITIDSLGHVALCNTTASTLIGLPRAQLLGLSVTELPLPLSSQLFATLSDGQARPQVEGTLEDRQSKRIPVVCSSSALRDKPGFIIGALIVFSDLTRIKALEVEKTRVERLASFAAMAKGFAHEIKNPLVAIKTFAELLPERFEEVDFREDFSKIVMIEISRIDGLVARLREIAAPAAAHEETGASDLREAVNEVLALLRGHIEQSHTVVSRDFRDETPFVAVERDQLKQLFLNLFMNALQAMGQDGRISIAIGRQRYDAEARIVVEISDSGPGIPEEVRHRVFEPFFSTRPNGSGLGLAICRGITDAHRGSIRIDSGSHRRGTAVTVEFPATVTTDQVPERVLQH